MFLIICFLKNLSNQLQEDAEYFGEDDSIFLLPPESPRTASLWQRHKKLWCVLIALAIVLAINGLVIYFVYFYNCVRLKVLAYNVWGMPGGIGGCMDKTERMAALAEAIGQQKLGSNGEDFDLILMEELWMSADHATIKSKLPEGFYMTEVLLLISIK